MVACSLVLIFELIISKVFGFVMTLFSILGESNPEQYNP
jgi:hypothetical protein